MSDHTIIELGSDIDRRHKEHEEYLKHLREIYKDNPHQLRGIELQLKGIQRSKSCFTRIREDFSSRKCYRTMVGFILSGLVIITLVYEFYD